MYVLVATATVVRVLGSSRTHQHRSHSAFPHTCLTLGVEAQPRQPATRCHIAWATKRHPAKLLSFSCDCDSDFEALALATRCVLAAPVSLSSKVLASDDSMLMSGPRLQSRGARVHARSFHARRSCMGPLALLGHSASRRSTHLGGGLGLAGQLMHALHHMRQGSLSSGFLVLTTYPNTWHPT